MAIYLVIGNPPLEQLGHLPVLMHFNNITVCGWGWKHRKKRQNCFSHIEHWTLLKWIISVVILNISNPIFVFPAYSRHGVSWGAAQKNGEQNHREISGVRESERMPLGKFNKRSFQYTRIWYTLWLGNFDRFYQHLSVTDCRWEMWYGGSQCKMGLTGLHDSYRLTVRKMNLYIYFAFYFWCFNLSLLHTCLWRALYVVLLGPGCLIWTVSKYSMLLLIMDIIWYKSKIGQDKYGKFWHIYLRPIFLQRLP